MKYAIFGGTFDPFTQAHRAIAERPLEFDSKLVDRVIILPTVVTYYRKSGENWLSDSQRIEVIKKMISKSMFKDKIIIDSTELELKKTLSPEELASRRSFHMVDAVKSRYGKDNEYFYLIGSDSLAHMKTWYRYEDLLKKVKLITVAGRDGLELENAELTTHVIEINDKFKSMSASKIREACKRDGISAADYVKTVYKKFLI